MGKKKSRKKSKKKWGKIGAPKSAKRKKWLNSIRKGGSKTSKKSGKTSSKKTQRARAPNARKNKGGDNLAKLKVKEMVEKALEFKEYSAKADVKASTTAIEFLADAVMGLVQRIDELEKKMKK